MAFLKVKDLNPETVRQLCFFNCQISGDHILAPDWLIKRMKEDGRIGKGNKMGIKSTMTISRDTAISRIREIDALKLAWDYRGIEAVTYDPDCDLRAFVDKQSYNLGLDKWTNSMLEDLMDYPFYRFSMFDNYRVTDSGKEEW